MRNIIDIGTEAKQVLKANLKRRSWFVQFYANSQDAGNSGRIFVARGFRPVPTENHPSQGQPVTPGGYTGDNIELILPECPYKGDVWVAAENANQTIEVFEDVIGEESA